MSTATVAVKKPTKEQRAKVTGAFEKARYSSKTGEWTVKRSFYYRNGGTSQKFADSVKKKLPEAVITEADEFYNNWPKDSYWQVKFKLEESA